MDNSWVKLYRKLGDNDIMQDAKACQVFLWLLIHVDKRTGETTVSRFQTARILKLNPNTFRTVLKRLEEKYQICTTKSTNKFTVISLLNWAKYNQYQEQTPGATPSKHHQNTIKTPPPIYIQDIRHKDIKTNDISLQKPVYGNQEINSLTELFKASLGLSQLDDSILTNRRYAKLCLNKFGYEKTQLAITATAQSQFWHTKITSFKGLYYNAVKIVSSGRGEVKSLDAEQILDSKNEGRQGVQTNGGGISFIKKGLISGD